MSERPQIVDIKIDSLKIRLMKMSDKKQAIRGEVDGEINRKRKKC